MAHGTRGCLRKPVRTLLRVKGRASGRPYDRAGITSEEIARAARELVAAYGPAAAALMQKRTRAVRRRGDAESATLWCAVAKAVEEHLAATGHEREGMAAD